MTSAHMVVAILPSLEEPDTIAAVTRAVDLALDDENSLIVHADASSTPVTAVAFRATPTRARRLCLRPGTVTTPTRPDDRPPGRLVPTGASI
ncbi:MAG: hypothetical protein ACT4NY_13895 [Pseudonocardiales bacterium]